MQFLLDLLVALGLLGPVANAPSESSVAPPRVAAQPQRPTATISAHLEAKLRGKLKQKHTVVVRFDEDVDVAALRREYPSSRQFTRKLRALRGRQRSKMFAAFRDAGLKFGAVRSFSLVSAVSLSATGGDILKMASIDGVAGVTSPHRKKPLASPKKPGRRTRAEPPTTVGCSKDAKRCPGGSTVARVGPSCAFPACPDA